MNRFPRIRRRPDHFASPHERARVRAAERLDGPLGLAESTWLDAHLADCDACRAIAAAYDADRQALRGLAAQTPQPPRDLWARTAAAIEQEAHGRRASGAPRRADTSAAPRRRLPIGALSGVAVIAVVVGASVLSQSLVVPAGPTVSTLGGEIDSGGGAAAATGQEDSGRIVGMQPTPFPVGAGEVQWVRENQDGTLAYNVAPIDEVCPAEAKDGCGTLSEGDARRLVVQAQPESIIASPDDETAVMVSRDPTGRQRVTVIDLDEGADPGPTETAETSLPSAAPVTSPSPTVTTGTSPSPDPETPEPTAQDTTVPSEAPESPAPSEEPAPTEEPTTPPPSSSPDQTPSLSPEPSLAADLVQGVRVVGHSAAFSGDGSWFAFTAEPADGRGGPDVFVWQVGAESATQLTGDGRSTFASWADGDVLVSRPIGRERGRPTAAVTVAVDPSTGEERPAGSGWRPTLDPSRARAVVWTGSIVRDPAGGWRPDRGQLVLVDWSSEGHAPDADSTLLVEGDGIGDFDVRWDETGEWFALWIADEGDPSVGALDLYRVDPATGDVEQPDGAPVDVRALAGFSIGDGRLAWATPPGQEGEGSRVQIVAWTADGVGTIETEPGEDVVVIR